MGSPIPFAAALARHAARKIMPTALGTDELQLLDKATRQRSFFSARTLIESVLGTYKDQLEGALDGETDVATMRLAIKDALAAANYQPAAEDAGTIKDLGSDQRINLVLKTNTQIAQNYGQWRQGQDPAVLDQWPAQELYRLEGRKEPREWMERWRVSGSQTGDPIGTGWTITTDGRLIALKNHPIWDRLGDTALWPDALDNPYPPYAFGSGMDVRDIDRDEAIALGLIDADTQVAPVYQSFEMEQAA
jgi:hypothetical protein